MSNLWFPSFVDVLFTSTRPTCHTRLTSIQITSRLQAHPNLATLGFSRRLSCSPQVKNTFKLCTKSHASYTGPLICGTTRPVGIPVTSIFSCYNNGSVTSLGRTLHSISRRFMATQAREFGLRPTRTALAQAEQAANGNPNSASAQLLFYNALLRANMPEIILERHQTGRYASDTQVENVYHKALAKVGQAEKGPNGGESPGITNSSRLSSNELRAIGQAMAAHARGGEYAITTNVPKGVAASTATTGQKDNPIFVVVDDTIAGTIFKWVKLLFTFVLVTYFLFVITSMYIEGTGMFKRLGSKTTEAQASQQNARFTDVHGCEEAKEELQEVVQFLKDPSKFSSLGGKLPKGVLLVGPPGTGKTLLARAVAGEAGVPFFFMSGSEFDEIYVGVGAKRVRELFASARAKAPSIVFIDELDAIGGKRHDRDAAYAKQTLNQLLVDLDGFAQNSGVIFLAATNFPQSLDKALTRPGRFDRTINVPLPDVRGRIQIIKHHMKSIKAGNDVNVDVLARGTPGFSGAELENLVNQAAVRASKSNGKLVTMHDFEWAKDKIMMGAERRSAVIPIKEKRMTAYHEGGHALVAMFTEGATPLYKATIMPRGMALGITFQLPEMDELSVTKKQYLAKIDVCMGGKVAEELIYGPEYVTSGASNDIQVATRIAHSMVTQLGMSETLGNVDFRSDYGSLSSQTKEAIEIEVRKLIEDGKQRALKILTDHKKELDLLATALVEYESLDAAEMRKVIKGEVLEGKMKLLPDAPIKLPDLDQAKAVTEPALNSENSKASGKSKEHDNDRPAKI